MGDFDFTLCLVEAQSLHTAQGEVEVREKRERAGGWRQCYGCEDDPDGDSDSTLSLVEAPSHSSTKGERMRKRRRGGSVEQGHEDGPYASIIIHTCSGRFTRMPEAVLYGTCFWLPLLLLYTTLTVAQVLVTLLLLYVLQLDSS